MSRGFISWPGLFRGDFLGRLGKLATLWYDEVFIQIAGEDEHLHGALERAIDAGLITDDIAVELAERWTPIPLIPFGVDPIASLANFPPALVQSALQTAHEFLMRDSQGRNNSIASPGGFEQEIRLTAYSLLWATQCWTSMNATSPCGFVTGGCEGAFIPKAFAPVTPQGYQPFHTMGSRSFPDVSEISWARVFELRAQPQFEAFRLKLGQLQEAASEDDRSTVSQLVEEIFEHDLAELSIQIRPTKPLATVHAAASMVPLPIPMVPVPLIQGEIDVREAFANKDRMGWFYFVLDFN